MFQSKLTSRSAWGQLTSINNSSAPGFIPIPCPTHHQYSITNICKAINCIQPLCPQCISNHVQLHQQSKKVAKIQNIITTRITCIEQLAKMKYQANKQIQEYSKNNINNIDMFLQANSKKIDIAYKKILKIIDDIFIDINKQMQIITNAFMLEKQKKQKQLKIKLVPLTQFYNRVSQYKQQLQSDDYIPALIELLNQPPKQPKLDNISDTQNYGSIQINQKYLDDIKTDINKFIKVIINCKDENFKNKLQMNMSKNYNNNSNNGSNNMKFSRLERSRSKQGSRDGSQSKFGESRRSNSKKKIFGCQSVISDIKPITGANSRIEMNNNSIYHTLTQNNNNMQQNTYNRQSSSSNLNYNSNNNYINNNSINNNNNNIKQIKYASYSTPIKITKSNYFNNSTHTSLCYFKQHTKTIFKASLQSIQAGFQRTDLAINFNIPNYHRTIIIPNGSVYLLGGQTNKQQISNKVYRLIQQQNTLREVQPMIQGRSCFGACYFQDCIYVAGGLSNQPNNRNNYNNNNKRAISDVQRYKIRQNRWQKLTPLNQPSYDFTMSALNSGRIIKLGGLTQNRIFINKIDIYSISNNTWNSYQTDNKFILTLNPGITQISNQSIIIFGGRIITNNTKISKCYILTEQQKGTILTITQGQQLYNQATFQSAYIYNGSILAIQNNQIENRNKLIMGYKYDQWKFVAC